MEDRALPFDASLEEYRSQSRELLNAFNAGHDEARSCFKWQHPRFQDRPLTETDGVTLGLSDAELVLARLYGFEDWNSLEEFAEAITQESPVNRYERAVEAVVGGDIDTLEGLLLSDPDLVRARSTRQHKATLLHYVASNGVEGQRQKTPRNAVQVARLLLESGADPDALAHMYDQECTTMSMLVSSSPPAKAGLQLDLAHELIEYGASLDGVGSGWSSALMTALVFGFGETAEGLVKRGARADFLEAAAGLGRAGDVARLLPNASRESRHAALAIAAQLGHTKVVQLLLDAGEDPNRLNPDGYHSHATPLHHAVMNGHDEVVHMLVAAGADLSTRDTIYESTPLGWAEYCGQPEIAAYLRQLGAP